MNTNQSIEKPIKRGWLRKKIGREYADEFVQPLVNKLDGKKS